MAAGIGAGSATAFENNLRNKIRCFHLMGLKKRDGKKGNFFYGIHHFNGYSEGINIISVHIIIMVLEQKNLQRHLIKIIIGSIKYFMLPIFYF